ncbi:MAG: DUF4013 domain-containing protein, partial [Methanobrevibacter sp.]|nr:DUF4013 domain-containing protein [Methanobrevibacter sp.]
MSVLMVGFALGGIFTYAYGIIDAENYLMGGIYLLISLLIGCIITGYHIKVIKSGIEHDDNVPVFGLYEDFMTGFDNLLVLILYFIIPALIVILVSLNTNLFGNAIDVVKEFVLQIYGVYFMDIPVDIAVIAISPILTEFLNSLAITLAVALVVFVIFSFLYLMGKARLANTGSLNEALNIFEAAKDMTRIGVVKVILLVLAIGVVIAIIEIILMIALIFYPFLLSVIYIILTPYMLLVSQRALGLLYSDI